jgi:hypothetical protein
LIEGYINSSKKEFGEMRNWLVGLGVVLALGLMFGSAYVDYSNREISLRNLASGQEDANKVIFDTMWKTIQQSAAITDEYKNSFKEIYLGIMDARYSKGDGTLMKWITENNPNFDSSMFKTLMDTVKGKREEFAQIQIKLRDIKREHDNLRTMFPSSMFLAGRPELKVQLVTSSNTVEAFNTGKEDSIELFK